MIIEVLSYGVVMPPEFVRPECWPYKCRLVAPIDCIQGMDLIPDNSIDLVVTSPPYNIGIKYPNYEDKMPWDEYWRIMDETLVQIYRTLKPDGRVCINHYLSFGTAEHRLAPISIINRMALERGFKHHAIAVWQDRTLVKLTAWGSWMSASAPYVSCPYEGILILYKNRWKKDRKGVTNISKEEFRESCSGLWNLPTSRCKDYPATFPIELPQRCIRLLSYEGDVVLDPFAGRGTTIKAAVLNNRIGVGFDIDPAAEKAFAAYMEKD